MKRFSYFLVSALLALMAVVSCDKYDDTELRQRLDKLEGSTINTINQQISAIDKSIADLKTVDTGINQALKELGITDAEYAAMLETLRVADNSLADNDSVLFDSIMSLYSDMQYMSDEMKALMHTLIQIDITINNGFSSLRQYTDSCRRADMDWVSCTYSTLEMQDSILYMLAEFEIMLSYVEENMSDSLSMMNIRFFGAIEQAKTSVMSWVNNCLTGYYDIATADAKLAALGARITTVDSTSTANIAKLQNDLYQAKTDLTAAYQKAISDAIETNNGTINKKIADEIAAVNTHIDTEIHRIDLAIAGLEGRIGALETTVAELTKVLGITFSDNNVSCSAGDIITIDYSITNSNGHATVYTINENGWSSLVAVETATTGTITIGAPNPIVNGTILVFVNEDNKSAIKALNFIEGSITISDDVVEVGAAGGKVSIDVDTDLQYTVSIPGGESWLHDVTIQTRSSMRHEKITLSVDASALLNPRNSVVRILNGAGLAIAQYTVCQEGSIFGHEYVDLGLSVLWGKYNVGATVPEGHGDYFAWGETEPYYEPDFFQSPHPVWKPGKSGGYSTSSYKYSKDTYNTFTKYCVDSYYGYNGFTDNKTILDPGDDAANVNWGGSWRMPTKVQFDELINPNNCTWNWASINGISGYRVTSKRPGYEGNFIFLPATGYMWGNNYSIEDDFGSYWSSSLWEGSNAAWCLGFSPAGPYDMNGSAREAGNCVRPVSPVSVISISISKQSVDIIQGGSEKLLATVRYENGATASTASWSSSNETVATVDQSGKVTAISVGTCTITATSYSFSVTCSVAVKPADNLYVDLGLSVKWATCNVGAAAPEEYGEYYAWGETDPKSEYSWSTYKYCNGSSTTLTKYPFSSSYGYDNEIILDPEDDAAYMNWGSGWYIPTYYDFQELMNTSNCTWTWTTLNGVKGYEIVSRKSGYEGNSIFLPAAGGYNGTILSNVGTHGNYWCGSFDLGFQHSLSSVYFYSGGFWTEVQDRCRGLSIRPVCR